MIKKRSIKNPLYNIYLLVQGVFLIKNLLDPSRTIIDTMIVFAIVYISAIGVDLLFSIKTEQQKRIYISGKITGIEDMAMELFEMAENQIRQYGHIPVNPMKLNHNHDQTWKSYMKEDLKALHSCDAIFALPNHTDSRGAKIEIAVAKSKGLPVIIDPKTMLYL